MFTWVDDIRQLYKLNAQRLEYWQESICLSEQSETFVERDRFAGTCYKAANWVLVGQTKGRGKLGPAGKISVPIKDLWLYPLERNFRHILTS
jgi:hypothetical protein